MLEVINKLFENLNRSEIRYCHWKSNIFLKDALSGKTDLDLLVDEKDRDLFESILTKMGFKNVLLPNWEMNNYINHFYGLDEKSGIIVHLHIYYSVITGGDILKNYRLPLDDIFFSNTEYFGPVRIPKKSLELIMFVIRTFLKYGSIVEHILIFRENNNIKKEKKWLIEENTIEEALSLLKEYLPFMDSKYFLDCIRALESNTSVIHHFFLGRKMKFYLKEYTIYPSLKVFFITYYRIFKKILQRVIFKRRNSSLRGIIVAVVGPEASGKSTVVAEIENWLKEHFAVKSIHAGRPPSTLLTFFPNLFLPLLRFLFPRHRTSVIEEENLISSIKSPERRKSILYIIRALMIAYDRKKLLDNAYQLKKSGVIVISDRYPTSQVGAVDSAQLDYTSLNKNSIIYHLSKIENQIYKSILPPDVVIQLNLPVDVAVKRNATRQKKGTESEEYVRRRYLQSAKSIFPEEITCKINTDKPLQETILSVKNFIWRFL